MAKRMMKFTIKNELFDELFPIIKQQKPGYDFYSFQLTIMLIICFYVILFFSDMSGDSTSLAE